MNASTKNETGQPAFGPEMLEGMAAFGRDALERTMRLTAEATVRACRGAAAAGTARLEAAHAMRETMAGGGSGNAAALAASSEAAIDGMETCMEKAIDFARTATDAGVETVGRSMAARTVDEWVGVQIESASRMMELGLAHAAELSRIVTDTSSRCADPLKARAEGGVPAS